MTDHAPDRRERRDWIRLIRSENVGPATFRQLMQRYGTAGKALAALPELSRRGGMAGSLAVYPVGAAEQDLDRADEIGARFILAREPDYPALLQQIDSAPPVLCVKGDGKFLGCDSVAVVGARNASAIGRKFARQLASEIAAAGFVIASGLARGIDTAAHEAALDRGTIAVLAGGLDIIYPPENQDLHEAIGKRGLLVTEMTPGTVPRAEHFPRRNRIISGLSRAVVVVEAALHSGSLITARLANEQGREVFAVPGSPLDPRCEGANRLIREGANLLTSARDVIDALSALPTLSNPGMREAFNEPAGEEPDDQARSAIMELLSPSAVDIDDLIRESGLAPQIVLGILLELELAGKIQRHGRLKVSLA